MLTLSGTVTIATGTDVSERITAEIMATSMFRCKRLPSPTRTQVAYSWKNRVIGAGETQVYSVVIGIGGVGSEGVVDHDDDAPDFPGFCSFVVTASAGVGGSITPSGAVVVDDLSDVSFTITPDAGYTIKDLLVDGKSAGPASTFVLQGVRYNRTVEALFEPLSTEIENPFLDVMEDDWFFDPVLDVYHRGLLLGTGEGIFDPNGACTRAMIPTILYRMEGSPELAGASEGKGSPMFWQTSGTPMVLTGQPKRHCSGAWGGLFRP